MKVPNAKLRLLFVAVLIALAVQMMLAAAGINLFRPHHEKCLGVTRRH